MHRRGVGSAVLRVPVLETQKICRARSFRRHHLLSATLTVGIRGASSFVTGSAYFAIQWLLEAVSPLRTVLRQRHDFRSVFGHQHRVFELSGQFAVTCSNGPTVGSIEDRVTCSDIDHGFDGETHARFEMVVL